MEEQRAGQIRALLASASSAHRNFEQNELAGVRDEEWPAWYSSYLLAHGLDRLIDHKISEAELSLLLMTCDDEFRSDQPLEEWPDYYAAGSWNRLAGARSPVGLARVAWPLLLGASEGHVATIHSLWLLAQPLRGGQKLASRRGWRPAGHSGATRLRLGVPVATCSIIRRGH